ncbi:MAG: TetR/AcrR family transcriptional regulator [Oscillospiraceae bacterium]|nr:TetR/AcrR family transcriptional regulator [Oscillospiraceae bacterium]
MDTKEKILYNSLEMFSKLGYNAVSVRDIAKTVNIKESSIYYHFKNKQEILDSMVKKYEDHIKELTNILNTSIADMDSSIPFSFESMKAYYFEQYLFDPFCNQMMRFMMIEQFHNETMQVLYDRYLFELPETIQTGTFLMMSRMGIISEQQARMISRSFFTEMTMLTFRYLLNGELTEKKKNIFCEKAFSYFNDIMRGEAHG